MQRRNDQICPRKSHAVEQHKLCRFARRAKLASHATAPLASKLAEQEFQRIHVKKYNEQQHRIQHDRRPVMHRIATEKQIMRMPEHQEKREAQRERNKSPYRHTKLAERFWSLQGNHKKRQG